MSEVTYFEYEDQVFRSMFIEDELYFFTGEIRKNLNIKFENKYALISLSELLILSGTTSLLGRKSLLKFIELVAKHHNVYDDFLDHVIRLTYFTLVGKENENSLIYGILNKEGMKYSVTSAQVKS